MTTNIIDARGQACPRPIILTKKALNDSALGERFIVLIDNETARENVERFLSDNGVLFRTMQKENYFQVEVSRTGTPVTSEAVDYCQVEPSAGGNGKHLICIKSDRMGMGDDELGAILMKGFINTIKEVAPLPQKIVFYNGGVRLAVADSPLVPALKELESLGVEIIVCGTCADFYKVKDRIAVGRISNMYDIATALTSAAKVICP